MNTPAHLAASLIVWRNEPSWSRAAGLTFGAFLPDLPMFGFYVYQKFIGSTEQLIWSTLYFQPEWQLFFDLFNSIPIAVLAFLISRWNKFRVGELIALSAALHMLCDLPLHHDDAHRHFLPLSNVRFESPVSYWDPKHHGRFFAITEMLGAMFASGFVAFRGADKPLRVIARLNLGLYLVISVAIGIWLFSST